MIESVVESRRILGRTSASLVESTNELVDSALELREQMRRIERYSTLIRSFSVFVDQMIDLNGYEHQEVGQK